MRRKKMLTGVLTAALLVGCISPLGVTGTELPEEVRAEQLVMFDETEMQKEEEEAVTAEEDVKNAEADENGFIIIRDGVLTGYTGDGGDVTIPDGVTCIGNYAFYGCSSLTSITIPDSVTSISEGAFYGCSSLTAINVSEGNENYTSENGILYNVDKRQLIQYPAKKAGAVTIPDSVTGIREGAFYECSSLTSITIPDSVRWIGNWAFKGCSSLTSITIPDSVEEIEGDLFYECSSLTAINVSEENEEYTSENGILYSVNKNTLIQCPAGKIGEITIPDSVTNIRYYAFYGCSSLTAINVSEGNGNYTSENGILYNVDKDTLIQCPAGKIGEIIIPGGVTSIGTDAFYGCSSLTSVTIPDSVTSIGNNVFKGCSSLTSITIPDSVTSIGDVAFYGCSSLTSITIPDNVTEIGDTVFWGCSSLMSITIPDSVTSIGDVAFKGCSSLTSITIPDSVTCIGVETFYGCSSLTSITIPDSVTDISADAFYGCSSLTAINVSERNKNYTSENGILYNVDKDTLIHCPAGKIGEIIIPDSVTSIGDGAFYGYSSLTSITIPDSVTSIGDVAFKGCSSLTSITIPDSVTSIGDYDVFADCNENLIIYCVKGSCAEEYAIRKGISYQYISEIAEKKEQTITAADITKTFGDSAFSIGAATDGDGTLTYVSDNISIATVDSAGTITLTGAGTVHITITASETDTYKAAEKVITITVEKKVQTIAASDITKTLGDAAFSLNAAVDGDGTLTYVSDNPSVAAITENGTVTLVSAGTAHITIKVSETTNYKAAEKIITVTVNPAETPSKTPSENPETNEQTITAKNITKTYGDKAFSLGAKTNGGGKLTYKISNTKIATIDKKGKVTIKGCGRTQIKITAAANGNYQKATKTITLTVKPKKVAVTSVKSTKSKALTVKWKQDKKAKGYIVEYSTDKKFKKNVKTVTISKNSTVSKTVTKLKGGKKYYVRVCAYTTADGKKIKGSYSKVMNAKVKK